MIHPPAHPCGGCRSARAISGRAAVLPDDRREDEREGEQTDQIEPASFLVGNLGEREQALADPEKEESRSEGEEQAVASPFPEAQEEQSGEQEAGDDSAR